MNEKVDIYDKVINEITERHCPVRRVRIKHEYSPWQTPLMIMLRKLKNRTYNTGKPTWKYLARLLKHLGRKAQIKYCTKVNNLLQNSQNNWRKAVNEVANNWAPIKKI